MGAGLGLPRTVAPAGDTKGPRRSSKSGVQVSRHYFCRKWKRFRLGRGIHTLSTPESARRSYAHPHAARRPSPSAGPKSTRHRRRGAGSTRTGARAPTPVALGPAPSPAFPQGLPAQDTRAHPAGQKPSKSRTEASAAKWNDMQMQADVSTQQGQAERGRRARVHGAPGAHLAWPLPPAPPHHRRPAACARGTGAGTACAVQARGQQPRPGLSEAAAVGTSPQTGAGATAHATPQSPREPARGATAAQGGEPGHPSCRAGTEPPATQTPHATRQSARHRHGRPGGRGHTHGGNRLAFPPVSVCLQTGLPATPRYPTQDPSTDRQSAPRPHSCPPHLAALRLV